MYYIVPLYYMYFKGRCKILEINKEVLKGHIEYPYIFTLSTHKKDRSDMSWAKFVRINMNETVRKNGKAQLYLSFKRWEKQNEWIESYWGTETRPRGKKEILYKLYKTWRSVLLQKKTCGMAVCKKNNGCSFWKGAM